MMTINESFKIMGEIPITLLIPALIIVLIMVFRKQIAGILERFTGISYSRTSTFKYDGQLAGQNKKSQISKELYFNPWLPQTLLGQEDSIWEDLKKKHPEIDPKQRDDPLVQLLIRHLASSQIREAFEFNHNFIHGSQIYLMRRINQRGPLSKNEMDIYFLDIQKQFPNAFKNHKTDDYLIFLLERSLIGHEEESYRITPLGIEFLGWLTSIGRDENRPL